jgi:hypothetical protein
MVFVSPDDVTYLGSLRKESSHSIPEVQADGIIKDPRPFTMNVYHGNDYTNLDPGEEAELEKATLAFGNAIQTMLNRGFRTRERQESISGQA